MFKKGNRLKKRTCLVASRLLELEGTCNELLRAFEESNKLTRIEDVGTFGFASNLREALSKCTASQTGRSTIERRMRIHIHHQEQRFYHETELKSIKMQPSSEQKEPALNDSQIGY